MFVEITRYISETVRPNSYNYALFLASTALLYVVVAFLDSLLLCKVDLCTITQST